MVIVGASVDGVNVTRVTSSITMCFDEILSVVSFSSVVYSKRRSVSDLILTSTIPNTFTDNSYCFSLNWLSYFNCSKDLQIKAWGLVSICLSFSSSFDEKLFLSSSLIHVFVKYFIRTSKSFIRFIKYLIRSSKHGLDYVVYEWIHIEEYCFVGIVDCSVFIFISEYCWNLLKFLESWLVKIGPHWMRVFHWWYCLRVDRRYTIPRHLAMLCMYNCNPISCRFFSQRISHDHFICLI